MLWSIRKTSLILCIEVYPVPKPLSHPHPHPGYLLHSAPVGVEFPMMEAQGGSPASLIRLQSLNRDFSIARRRGL